MKRKIAKLISPKQFKVFEEKIPVLSENNVLLKVLSVGLCHSEMSVYKGLSNIRHTESGTSYMETELEYPIEIGHEPMGIIEEVGQRVTNFKKGDYAGGLIKGAFASHLVVEQDKLVKIPKSTKQLKYCLPEPLMCITNILRAAAPKFGDYVAVIGCGAMGLMCISGLKRFFAKGIVAFDLSDSRLIWAKKMGATNVLNPKKNNIKKEIGKITNGKGIDIVIEITGSLKGLNIACSILKDAELFGYEGRGRIIISSLYVNNETLESSLGHELVFKAPVIHSVHPGYSRNYMKDAKIGIWGYINGYFPLDKLITHEFKLEDINKAFKIAELDKEKYIKGIIVP